MNRDPFDTLRSRNPAPPESLPEAPMTVASRIAAGHPSLRRGLAIATAAAAVVLVAGGGWLIWSRAGDRPVVGPATTTTAETTTTAAATIDEVPELVVYFLRDGALIPVARDLRVLNMYPLPDLGPLAIDLLLWGPGAWDAGPLPDPVGAAEAQLTTAIPEGTTLLGLTIADGVAIVDLSSEFADASPQAIAQVVYTLTGLDGVAAAAFSIEGTPQAIGSLTSGLFTPYLEPASTGTGLDSIGRDFLDQFRPALMVEHPALGGTLRAGEAEAVALFSPLDAAEVTLTLTAADGTLLWSALARPSDPACSSCPNQPAVVPVPPEVLQAAGGYGVWATLRAEGTASDGSVLDPAEIPVWLEPDVPFTEATTTTLVEAADDAPTVVVYFLDADTGAAVPVARDLSVLNVRPLPDLGPLAVELLLSGPGAWDAAPLDAPVAAAEARLTTAIPHGTTLLSIDMTDGTAAVDLSAEFLSGDQATQDAAFAQLVFTLTRLEGVERVRVLVAGSPASPLDGEPGPLTWQDVDGLVPPEVIAYPPLGGTLRLPDIIVAGGFGRLTLTLLDGDGVELWHADVAGGTDCCAAAEVPADLVDSGRWVTLQATGPEGGTAGAAFEMPIWLEPGPSAETTTTTFGLGDLQPFPADMTAGCAPVTVRDPAAFEDAFAEGRRDLADLCSVLGLPDWLTGSGLWIPVYDLADGSRLYLGYAGPGADGLIYANLVSPDGTVRNLLEG
jgi:spore germination protein GerM